MYDVCDLSCGNKVTGKQECLSQWLGFDAVLQQADAKLEDLRIQADSS